MRRVNIRAGRVLASDFPVGGFVEFVDGSSLSGERSTLGSVLHYPVGPLNSLSMYTPYEVLESSLRKVILLQEGNARMFDEVELELGYLNHGMSELRRVNRYSSDRTSVIASRIADSKIRR